MDDEILDSHTTQETKNTTDAMALTVSKNSKLCSQTE